MNNVERHLSTERSLASRDNDFATYIPLDCFVASLLAMTKGRRTDYGRDLEMPYKLFINNKLHLNSDIKTIYVFL